MKSEQERLASIYAKAELRRKKEKIRRRRLAFAVPAAAAAAALCLFVLLPLLKGPDKSAEPVVMMEKDLRSNDGMSPEMKAEDAEDRSDNKDKADSKSESEADFIEVGFRKERCPYIEGQPELSCRLYEDSGDASRRIRVFSSPEPIVLAPEALAETQAQSQGSEVLEAADGSLLILLPGEKENLLAAAENLSPGELLDFSRALAAEKEGE